MKTGAKLERKYGKMDGRVMYVRLNKGTQGLGISLSGHKDRAKMSVLVAGLNPHGNAYRDGQMKIGDTMLEVNGLILHQLTHWKNQNCLQSHQLLKTYQHLTSNLNSFQNIGKR